MARPTDNLGASHLPRPLCDGAGGFVGLDSGELRN